MKILLQIISLIGLGLTLIPSILVFQSIISPEACKNLMFLGTILWFSTSPFWMNKPERKEVD